MNLSWIRSGDDKWTFAVSGSLALFQWHVRNDEMPDVGGSNEDWHDSDIEFILDNGRPCKASVSHARCRRASILRKDVVIVVDLRSSEGATNAQTGSAWTFDNYSFWKIILRDDQMIKEREREREEKRERERWRERKRGCEREIEREKVKERGRQREEQERKRKKERERLRETAKKWKGEREKERKSETERQKDRIQKHRKTEMREKKRKWEKFRTRKS